MTLWPVDPEAELRRMEGIGFAAGIFVMNVMRRISTEDFDDLTRRLVWEQNERDPLTFADTGMEQAFRNAARLARELFIEELPTNTPTA